MNAVEQKNHRTAVQDLAQSCGSFAEATADHFAATDGALAAILKEQRLYSVYVDARFSQCFIAMSALRDRGFWSRMNWLLTGR